MSTSLLSLALWSLISGVVGVELVCMVIQVSLSPSARVAPCVALPVGVAWIALIGMVVQISLGPSTRVLPSSARHLEIARKI